MDRSEKLLLGDSGIRKGKALILRLVNFVLDNFLPEQTAGP